MQTTYRYVISMSGFKVFLSVFLKCNAFIQTSAFSHKWAMVRYANNSAFYSVAIQVFSWWYNSYHFYIFEDTMTTSD